MQLSIEEEPPSNMDNILNNWKTEDQDEDELCSGVENINNNVTDDKPEPSKSKRRNSKTKKQFFPPMDFVRAKITLGIKTSATLEEFLFSQIQL